MSKTADKHEITRVRFVTAIAMGKGMTTRESWVKPRPDQAGQPFFAPTVVSTGIEFRNQATGVVEMVPWTNIASVTREPIDEADDKS